MSFLLRVAFSLFLSVPLVAGMSLAGGDDGARAFELKPHKDRLFRYRKPIRSEDGGDFLWLPYDPLKDINARDEQPVRKVKGKYVSSRPTREQIDTSVTVDGRTVTHFAVGALGGGANMTVIFLHGRDGSRHLGFSDEKFGGNFNRVKNLMYRNGGIYVSADFTDFEEEGRKDITALVKHYRAKTRGKVVVACGSMGSFLCWRLARDKASAPMIDAYVIMGGFPDPAFLGGGTLEVPVGKPPIYFAHGGIDYVYDWKDVHRYYSALRQKSPGYPVRLAVFDGGKHGTPVRMIDWKVALNWIAKQ